MKLSTMLWIGWMVGFMSASLICAYQFAKDPKKKKPPFYYAGIVHKWVWLWVILLLVALILWTADVISGAWVAAVFLALIAFLIWAFILGLFRPFLTGLIAWGAKQ